MATNTIPTEILWRINIGEANLHYGEDETNGLWTVSLYLCMFTYQVHPSTHTQRVGGATQWTTVKVAWFDQAQKFILIKYSHIYTFNNIHFHMCICEYSNI